LLGALLIIFALVILTLAIVTVTNTEAIAQEQIKLEGKSDKGAFIVDVTWLPSSIGKVNTFDINFSDPETHTLIEDVKYDISIYSEDTRQTIIQKIDQYATQQKLSFGKPGSYLIRILNIEDLGENVSIPIQVTPEFPPLDIILTAAAMITGCILFLARLNCNTLFT
jgi:hypothetical protein